MNDFIRCPNCNSELYFCIDEWGYTPWHLHCGPCRITIAAPHREECINLLKEHHKENTYLEYYKDDIQLLLEDGKLLIDNEGYRESFENE